MADRIVHTSKMAWVLDPKEPMAGLVADGGIIVARVSPGCWGAMITPDYASGHEVTHPIAVEGAEIGDSVCLKIKKINVLSLATTSGTDSFIEGNFIGDPFVAIHRDDDLITLAGQTARQHVAVHFVVFDQ